MYLGSFEVNVSEPILFTNIIILAMPHPTYEMEIPKPRKYAGKHTTCPGKVKIQSLFFNKLHEMGVLIESKIIKIL